MVGGIFGTRDSGVGLLEVQTLAVSELYRLATELPSYSVPHFLSSV